MFHFLLSLSFVLIFQQIVLAAPILVETPICKVSHYLTIPFEIESPDSVGLRKWWNLSTDFDKEFINFNTWLSTHTSYLIRKVSPDKNRETHYCLYNKSGDSIIDFIGKIEMFKGNKSNTFLLFGCTNNSQPAMPEFHFIYNGNKFNWPQSVVWPSPKIWNDKLLILTRFSNELPKDEMGNPGIPYVVIAGKDTIFKFSDRPSFSGYPHAFFVVKNKWVLEAEQSVFVNGISQNQQFGFDGSFSSGDFDGKVFYLFKKGTVFGMVWDGKILPNKYDYIPHYACCSPSLFNPRIFNRELYFFGRRDSLWYRIEYITDSSSLRKGF